VAAPGVPAPLAPADPFAPAPPFVPEPGAGVVLGPDGQGSGLATGNELEARHGWAGSGGAAGGPSASATAGTASDAVAPTLK
jgi:hypothetical protein